MAALGSHPSDLCGSQLGVPQRQDAQRDEPAGVGPGPGVEVPVVVGPHGGERHVLVGSFGEHLSGKAGEGRKAHGGHHPIGVHVPHPFVHVPASSPHLGIGGGVGRELLAWLADRRVVTDEGEGLALIHPSLTSIVVGDDPRGIVGVTPRNPIDEHVDRFQDVVVHADERHVVDVHAVPPPVEQCPVVPSYWHDR